MPKAKTLITNEEFAKLPEGDLKDSYVEHGDGKRMRLAPESIDGWGIEDVMGLKQTAQSERELAKKANQRVKDFDGMDIEAVRAALKFREESKNWTPKEKAEAEAKAYADQLVSKVQKELDSERGTSKNLLSQLDKHLRTAQAVAALSAHKAPVELMLPHVLAQTKMEPDHAGEFVSRVVDKAGITRITPRQGSQDPMSIDELVAEMKNSQSFGPFFGGAGVTGGGAASSGGAGRSAGQFVIPAGATPQEYRAVREAAQKAGRPLQFAGSKPSE